MAERLAPYPTSIWLDDETRDKIKVLMEELGLNRSSVIREAINRMASDTDINEVRRLVAELNRVLAAT